MSGGCLTYQQSSLAVRSKRKLTADDPIDLHSSCPICVHSIPGRLGSSKDCHPLPSVYCLFVLPEARRDNTHWEEGDSLWRNQVGLGCCVRIWDTRSAGRLDHPP